MKYGYGKGIATALVLSLTLSACSVVPESSDMAAVEQTAKESASASGQSDTSAFNETMSEETSPEAKSEQRYAFNYYEHLNGEKLEAAKREAEEQEKLDEPLDHYHYESTCHSILLDGDGKILFHEVADHSTIRILGHYTVEYNGDTASDRKILHWDGTQWLENVVAAETWDPDGERIIVSTSYVGVEETQIYQIGRERALFTVEGICETRRNDSYLFLYSDAQDGLLSIFPIEFAADTTVTEIEPLAQLSGIGYFSVLDQWIFWEDAQGAQHLTAIDGRANDPSEAKQITMDTVDVPSDEFWFFPEEQTEDSVLIYVKNSSYGYRKLSLEPEIVIEAQYEYAYGFKENWAVVEEREEKGAQQSDFLFYLIDKQGKKYFAEEDFRFEHIADFGLFAVGTQRSEEGIEENFILFPDGTAEKFHLSEEEISVRDGIPAEHVSVDDENPFSSEGKPDYILSVKLGYGDEGKNNHTGFYNVKTKEWKLKPQPGIFYRNLLPSGEWAVVHALSAESAIEEIYDLNYNRIATDDPRLNGYYVYDYDEYSRMIGISTYAGDVLFRIPEDQLQSLDEIYDTK